MVRDVVSFLEKSVEERGQVSTSKQLQAANLMKTGIMVNRILKLFKETDPELCDVFLISWYVILYF